MTKDIIWKTFEKTGDLNAYLLLKEVENLKLNDDSEEKANELNRVSS